MKSARIEMMRTIFMKERLRMERLGILQFRYQMSQTIYRSAEREEK